MIGRRRRGGMSLGRVAKKAAVATVVSRAVNNAMDNRMNRNLNDNVNRGQSRQQDFNQQALTNHCPSCRAANLEQAKFCLNCGTGLTGSIQPQQPISTNCSGCNADLTGINGNFCPFCRREI